MIITQDHWLDPVERKFLPGGKDMKIRRFLIIHCTCGAGVPNMLESERWKSGICAHIVIDRNGKATQCRPFDKTCGHAGVSVWHDSKTTYNNLNNCSIGIELANAGPDKGALAWARKNQPGFKSIQARHKNGGPLLEWECYYPEQVEMCKTISKLLCQKYNLDDLVGHEDVSPSRRDDPGPAFNMEELRTLCGFPHK